MEALAVALLALEPHQLKELLERLMADDVRAALLRQIAGPPEPPPPVPSKITLRTHATLASNLGGALAAAQERREAEARAGMQRNWSV